MLRFFSNKRSILPTTILVFVVMVAMGEYLAYQQRQHQFNIHKNDVLMHASLMRAKIEYEIHTTLNLTMGLTVFIASNPDFSAAQFTPIARELQQKAPHIRNIALARDNVISHVYPLEGNEAALGLDYLDYPEQRDSLLRAIKYRKTVIAGPVDLVQGGRGFISRTPIFIGTAEQRYWGIANIVVDVDTFYRNCGLHNPNSPLHFALRGKDGLGSKGQHFFGNPDLFSAEQSVILTIKLPVGSWQLAAVPAAGWEPSSLATLALRFFNPFFAMIISLLLFALLTALQKNRHLALHDSLTQLTNRRFFDQFLHQSIAMTQRNRGRFVLLYLDLNDFKLVNDQYGHKKGDLVLTTIAHRLREALRDSDIQRKRRHQHRYEHLSR